MSRPSELTLDRDLPGPRAPVLWQTVQWMSQPPLRWTLRMGARYGETFRLRVFGPRHSSEPGRVPVVPRTVVMISRPDHMRELFARSRDELRAGEAREFIAWHTGTNAVPVVDGATHLAERQLLQSVIRRCTEGPFEQRLREGVIRALQAWPVTGRTSLARLVEQVALDGLLHLFFGPQSPAELEQLRALVEAGAVTTTVAPEVLVLPLLQRDFGRWSPGGRLKRTIHQFEVLAEQLIQRGGIFQEAVAELELGATGSDVRALLLQRVRTILSGWRPTVTAAVWLCFHILGDPRQREHGFALARSDDEEESSRYFEAAARESLRLIPPFLGAFRRVARPVKFGGISWQTGTLIMPAFPLTHRRPELFPEPERFSPERFLEKGHQAGEYVPFGGGVRHCMGEQLGLLHMRLVLTELLRAFDIRPLGEWSGAEQRRYTSLMVRDPLEAEISRRAAAPRPAALAAAPP